MSDPEFGDGSDHEVSENHAKLIESVTELDKGQRVKKAARSEPSLEVSEFHLVKSGASQGSSVRLNDLAKTLGQRATHAEIGRKLKATQKKSNTLRKPLEKPAAARIKRVVGFENVKKELGKWDAVVSKNRTSEHLNFPLRQDRMRLETSNEFLKRFKVQSELELALAALEPVKEIQVEEQENEAPMSIEQIIERRKEAARLRAQQSYREAKAHRQNKIKSKKFHRIERKQKVKQQLKEFEELQKTDPEAALEKLELLEKSRAEERMSLRHKSTGQWAKNKQIRAKYDKESRQALAQQLSISRDLTQKMKNQKDEEEDEDEDEESAAKALSESDKDNPWTHDSKNPSEIDEFISSYRKYWDAKNKSEKNADEGQENKDISDQNGHLESQQMISETFEVPRIKDLPANLNPVEEVIVENSELMFDDRSENSSEKSQDDDSDEEKPLENAAAVKKKRKSADLIRTEISAKKSKKLSKDERSVKKEKKCIEAAGTSTWLVTPLRSIEIDDIFDAITVKSSEKFSAKLKNMKNGIPDGGKKKRVSEVRKKEKVEYAPELGFKSKKVRPVIDEQMAESTEKTNSETNEKISLFKRLANAESRSATEPKEAEIDPNKFINVKPKHIKSQLPDVITGGDEGLDDSEEEEEEKHNLISEAFADDDVVDEFRREKTDEIEKSQPENVDLSLPGWGSWGGKNVQVSARKKRRFILKYPKDKPRKDENKGDVIIIEEKNPKIKEHQVSELPFPFNSVKDFEASVRAPIGRTFIPENAHRKLTEPIVKTKLGKIIEPMDHESLVDTKKMNTNKKKSFPQKKGKKSRK